MFKNLLIIIIVLFNLDLFASEIIYNFPINKSNNLPLNSDIILSFDKTLNRDLIHKSNFEIIGNKNGKYEFDIIYSTNNSTIILRPKNSFSLNENVKVLYYDIDNKNITNISKNTTKNINKSNLVNNSKNIGLELNFTTVKNNNLFNDSKTYNNTSVNYLSEPYIKINKEELEAEYFNVINPTQLNPKNNSDILSNNNILLDSLPSNFPKLDIKVNNNPKDGYMLVAPRVAANSGYGNYLIILDKNGVPVKYRATTPNTFNFKQQENGLYIAAETFGSHLNITGNGLKANVRIFDKDLNLLESYQMGNNYIAGPHEFIMLPNGHSICIAQNPIPYDMTKIIEGGNPNAFIVGNVIQEFDRNKNIIFQWRSIDHIAIEETYLNLKDPVISYAHINALEVDRDGNWLISPRHTAAIMKINRKNGEIMWRLGGKKNQFEFVGEVKNGPEYFSYQHDIRRLKNGDITMFDNGNLRTPQFSRALRYKLDEVNKKATFVWEYRNSPDVYAGQQGSLQIYQDESNFDGGCLIGWGTATQNNQVGITELDAAGNKTFELNFPLNTSHYRVQKVDYPPCPVITNIFLEELLETNEYDFNNSTDKTGLILKFNSLKSPVSYNNFTIKKYDCSPIYPEFNGETPLIKAHRIELYTFNFTSFSALVTLDLKYYSNTLDLKEPSVYYRSKIGEGLFTKLNTLYNKEENYLQFVVNGVGELIIGEEQLFDKPLTNLVYPNINEILDISANNRLEWTNSSHYDSNTLKLEVLVNGEQILTDSFITQNLYYDFKLPNDSLYKDLEVEVKWSVVSKYKNVGGDESEIRSFYLKPKFINTVFPNGGEILSNQNKSYVIRWDDNFMDTVKIELYKNDMFYKTIKDSLFSYTNNYLWTLDTNYDKSNNYKVKIISFNNNILGESTQYFAIDNLSSISENIDGTMINVSINPNPVINEININYNFNQINSIKSSIDELVIRIFDLNGIEIYSQIVNNYSSNNLNNILIDFNKYSKGNYFLTLFMNEKMVNSLKFTKN